MSPDEPLVVTIERLVAGGDGLGRLDDGRIVFVPGVVGGETVAVDVRERRRDYARAELVDVVAPSPERRPPPCPHRVRGCGGCDWMHVQPEAQLAAKVEIVRESLRRVGRLPPEDVDRLVVAGGAVAPEGYRTTLRVAGTGGGVGFRRATSDEVVEVGDCRVAHPELSALLGGIRLGRGLDATLRTSDVDGALTVAVVRSGGGRRRRRGEPDSTGADVDALPEGTVGRTRDAIVERVDGVDLRVSARSFFQSGPQAAGLLVAAVRRSAPEATGARHLLDAYGGVGLFAATVGRDADRVTVVERSGTACGDARHNLSGRPGVSVVQADVGDWRPPPDAPGVEVVVADPARAGLGRDGTAAIGAIGAPVLVLVSCDPVSLARDLRLLADESYRPERVEVLDLFPETHHVETVTRFVRHERAITSPGTP